MFLIKGDEGSLKDTWGKNVFQLTLCYVRINPILYLEYALLNIFFTSWSVRSFFLARPEVKCLRLTSRYVRVNPIFYLKYALLNVFIFWSVGLCLSLSLRAALGLPPQLTRARRLPPAAGRAPPPLSAAIPGPPLPSLPSLRSPSAALGSRPASAASEAASGPAAPRPCSGRRRRCWRRRTRSWRRSSWRRPRSCTAATSPAAPGLPPRGNGGGFHEGDTHSTRRASRLLRLFSLSPLQQRQPRPRHRLQQPRAHQVPAGGVRRRHGGLRGRHREPARLRGALLQQGPGALPPGYGSTRPGWPGAGRHGPEGGDRVLTPLPCGWLPTLCKVQPSVLQAAPGTAWGRVSHQEGGRGTCFIPRQRRVC